MTAPLRVGQPRREGLTPQHVARFLFRLHLREHSGHSRMLYLQGAEFTGAMPQVLHQRSVRHRREMVFQLRQTHSSTYPLISDP
jgi:hypothetical protein